MAALTVTSTAVNNGPVLSDRQGLNIKHVKATWGPDIAPTSLSVSVCLQMVPIPDGARIIDMWFSAKAPSGETVGAMAVGDGSSTARYMSAISVTASARLTRMTGAGGFGFRYSLTQSDFVQFDTIDVTFSGAMTSTLTMCLEMVVWYLMDRPGTFGG